MTCPICSRPTVTKYRPFCSRRCADVDLGRWFSGAYAIAAEPVADEPDNGEKVPDEPDGRN
jgi:uncharacterized protein